jgi:hypothetical protein
VCGVTTNPSLYARTGGKLADFEDHMAEICRVCEGLPVSAESQAKTTEGMMEDAERLAALAPNIVVKLPICEESLPATHQLASEGIRVNMTLVFSAPQALLARPRRRALHQPVRGPLRRHRRRRPRPARDRGDAPSRTTPTATGTRRAAPRSSPPPCAPPTT